MGIKNVVKKIGGKAGNAVAKLSTLSPEQIEKIQEEREKYLTKMPDLTDKASEELTNRLLGAGAVEIYNAYLNQIKQLYVPIDVKTEYDGQFNAKHNIRFINITKWVTDKKENHLDKLVNVYEVLSNEECNIALVFNRTKTITNVYLAVANTKNANNNVDVDSYMQRLKDAIKGNFPGSEWADQQGIGVLPCLDNNISYSVACASNIPTEKSEKFVSQTIEKLIDGIVPKNVNQEYTIVLLATPVQDIEDRKLHLSELYTALSPYSSWQTNYTFNENKAYGSTATVGINVGVSAGTQAGQNQGISNTDGITDSNAHTDSITDTHSSGETKSHTDTKGSSNTVGTFSSAGGKVGIPFVAEGQINGGLSYNHGWNESASDTLGKTVTDSVSKGTSHTLSRAVSQSIGKTVGTFASHSFGGNFGANFSRASSVTATIGTNEGITQSYINYTIKHTLELLEQQMKRYEQCTALGMWDFAAYILSEDRNIVNNVAHSYIALTQGEESYMSQSSINLWRGDLGENSQDAKEICEYIRNMRHPMFGLNPRLLEIDATYLVYPSVVTATTSLSGKELSYSLNFPQKSIAGLPVIECAEFGRNITTYNLDNLEQDKLSLGYIFHMNHQENTPVWLSKNSLASHVFVTGSTGSGKSNTVYQILNEAMDKGIHFMVIEPAKGEYKNAFSYDEDIAVYSTNPKISKLLQINPFSFPKDIHVLEHIDRIVEIFNVCWPMYAAMTAVLKNAIEVSYEDCGWNLTTSINHYENQYYPTFNDVCRNIKTIIDSSEYDNENKGAYKGSLLTRLKSLTNGIYGMIFTNDEISNEKLFDENVIVDLSRVGSTETKSLLMGMLVLKLQEYRMTSCDGMNQSLKHMTVLEEAHNLLKRTSMEQSSEGSNLIGKSVEMITNAIAEMRTYGEGFIIADQAPALLDMAAIRNTNTKIIMRLPDMSDRELVGKAANLSDDQITELAKLSLGVAAVYQNEWLQPVLCKIKKARVAKKMYVFSDNKREEKENSIEDRLYIATLLSRGDKIDNELQFKEKIDSLHMDDSMKVTILKWVSHPPKEPKMTKLAPIMSALFPNVKQVVMNAYHESNDPKEWTMLAQNELVNLVSGEIQNQVRRDILQAIITDYIYLEMNNLNDLKKWSEIGGLR